MARKDETRGEEDRTGEGRLARWSRLKREAVVEKKSIAEARQEPGETKTAALPSAPPQTTSEAGTAEQRKKIDDVTKDLPPIESLSKESDYTLFMREGVPEEARTAALRKLWRSDPAFTEPFPFEMHMEDYNKTFVPINAATDTLYRAGLGYLFDDDKAKAGTTESREGGSPPGFTSDEVEATASGSPIESLSSAHDEKIEIENIGSIRDATGEKPAEEKISMSGKKKRDQSP